MVYTQTQTDAHAESRDELGAALNTFYTIWHDRDVKAATSQLSSAPSITLWGTGPDETAWGNDEAQQKFHLFIENCPLWTEFELTKRNSGESGDLAWVADAVTGHFRDDDGAAGEISFLISSVWRMESGEYRLVHCHVSTR